MGAGHGDGTEIGMEVKIEKGLGVEMGMSMIGMGLSKRAEQGYTRSG